MNTNFSKKFLLSGVLALSLFAIGGTASAACDPKDPKCVPCDPKDPKCVSGTPCSPGYYKNHIDYWWNIYCTDSSNPTCANLLSALTCKGNDTSCGRSAAAGYLNDQSGCTE